MKLGLAIILTAEVDNKTKIIQSLSDDLKKHFDNKYYGDDVKSYSIGIVCVAHQFDQFFPQSKPKYTKGPKTITQEGIAFTLDKSLEYSIKLDFEKFKNASFDDVKKILAEEILSSLTVLDQIKSKIKDFDNAKFKSDLEKYFRIHNLIG